MIESCLNLSWNALKYALFSRYVAYVLHVNCLELRFTALDNLMKWLCKYTQSHESWRICHVHHVVISFDWATSLPYITEDRQRVSVFKCFILLWFVHLRLMRHSCGFHFNAYKNGGIPYSMGSSQPSLAHALDVSQVFWGHLGTHLKKNSCIQ